MLDGGDTVQSDLTVWAGGIGLHPVVPELGLDHTERGLVVDEYMRCTEDIYAAGDVATYESKIDRALYAITEAATVAGNIARAYSGMELNEVALRWSPNLVYLGRWDGLFELRGATWRGRIPALMRVLGVEQRYLWTRRYLL